MNKHLGLMLCLLLCGLAAQTNAQTFTMREVSGRSGSLVPVTLSFVGARGDYFGPAIHPIVNGTPRNCQVDVLSTWPDGSISHALISFLTNVQPHQNYRITFGRTARPFPYSFQDRPGLVDALKWRIDIQEANGRTSFYQFGREQAYLLWRAAAWAGIYGRGAAFGDVVRDFEWKFRPSGPAGEHPNIEIIARWRFYTGYLGAHLELVVENSRTDSIKDDLEYTRATIRTGRNYEHTLADLQDRKHLFQVRFAVEHHAGMRPPTLRIRPDIPYLARMGIMPPLDDDFEIGSGVTQRFIDHIMRDNDRGVYDDDVPLGIPLNHGPVFKNQPGSGDRHDIGWYPKWAYFCLNGFADNAERFAQAADMNGSGVFPIHNRDSVTGELGLRYDNPWWSSQLKFQPRFRNPAKPNTAHMPMLGFTSYLLTGRKIFLEEMVSWTCYALRDHYPNIGVIKNMGDRKAAWAIRNLTHLATVLPDDHPLRGYFLAQLQATATNYGTRLDTSLPLGTFGSGGWRASGRRSWPCGLRVSPWQNAWFSAMCWTGWKLHGMQEMWDCTQHNWDFYRRGYLTTDSFTAPNGDVITADPRLLMQYSKLVSVYTPEVKIVSGNPSWGVKDGSIVNCLNWAETQWYERIQQDYPVRGPYNPAYPTAGPEPINWRPVSGTYSPPPSNHYDEYGVGRVALHWIAQLEGLPQSAAVINLVEPWIQAQLDRKSAPHPPGVRFKGEVYSR